MWPTAALRDVIYLKKVIIMLQGYFWLVRFEIYYQYNIDKHPQTNSKQMKLILGNAEINKLHNITLIIISVNKYMMFWETWLLVKKTCKIKNSLCAYVSNTSDLMNFSWEIFVNTLSRYTSYNNYVYRSYFVYSANFSTYFVSSSLWLVHIFFRM